MIATGDMTNFRVTRKRDGEFVMIAPMWAISKAFVMEYKEPKLLLRDLLLTKVKRVTFKGSIGGSRFDSEEFQIELEG